MFLKTVFLLTILYGFYKLDEVFAVGSIILHCGHVSKLLYGITFGDGILEKS